MDLHDIFVFLFITGLFVNISKASHNIRTQYTGQGLVSLENEEFRDTDDKRISCTLTGDSFATINWKWKNDFTHGPEHYFTWTTNEIEGDPKLSSSSLIYANTITEAEKRDIKTRTIYAIGAHKDDPLKTTRCDEVLLSFVWTPEGKPTVSDNNDPLIIGINNTTLLACQLEDKGNPDGQVRWVKNGNLQSGSENISIHVNKDINGDKWQCYYYNTVGDGDYSDEVLIIVHWKPLKSSVLINKDRFVIGEDSYSQLTCQFTDKGNPEGQVRWIKNENLESESEYNTQILRIPVTKDMDGDKWQCYYYNTAGDGDYSDEVLINVHWKPEGTPSLSINKDPVVIGEDSTAQLTCQLTDKGNTEGRVRWIKNGNLQSESEYNTQNMSIPVTKDINGDKWQCYYFNTAGDGDYSDEVMINVHWKPLKPLLTINKETFVIGEDSTAQLTCQLTDKGNPEGQVRWIKNGNLQSESEYSTQMISTPVTKDIDDDKWQCYYFNTAGDGDYSDEVLINVHWKPEKPSLSIDKETLVIGKDTEAQLTCQLIEKGNPEGQVRWIKNGNLQSESEYSTEIISIPVTKDIDDDKWQCYYFNTAGDGDYSDEVLINVHWSPGGATISADTQTPKRDDTFTLTCTGDRGNPPGRVLWYLSGTMVANTTNKQYTVTDAKESHNGNWSCIFNNYLKSGAQSESIQIQVQLTPEQGEVRITSITARNVVVNATPKTNKQKARRSIRSTTVTNMIIMWYSDNDKNNTVLVPPDTTQYALYNLTANTTYTIEVSYVNDQGIGAAATAYVTTKEFPLNLEVDPSIKRSWFSAVATLDIANSNSVARVEMQVCESADEMNCGNKSTTDIKNGTLEVKETSINGRYVTLSLYDEGFLIDMYSDDIDAPIVAFVLIGLGGLLVIVLIIVVTVVIIKKQGKGGKEKDMTRGAADGGTDTYSYSNPTMMANSQSRTGTGQAKALNAQPVYAEVPKGRTLAPIAVSADGGIYSQVEMSKKNARQSLKGLPMSKKAIDRIIFHKKDGYVNMTFQVRKKFTGDIEIGVCRVGDQSCTSKVSKQHEGGSKDVVMVLPIEEMSPESYSIHIKFIERGQVTQTVDLTYPYNKNLVKVAVLNEVYGTTASHNDRPTNVVSPSNADIEVEGVPQRPPRQGAPGEGVTYAVMDWNRSQAPGRPPRLSARSPAQDHVVYADVRPGGNVY